MKEKIREVLEEQLEQLRAASREAKTAEERWTYAKAICDLVYCMSQYQYWEKE